MSQAELAAASRIKDRLLANSPHQGVGGISQPPSSDFIHLEWSSVPRCRHHDLSHDTLYHRLVAAVDR